MNWFDTVACSNHACLMSTSSHSRCDKFTIKYNVPKGMVKGMVNNSIVNYKKGYIYY